MIQISAGSAVCILAAAIASPALVMIASDALAQEIRLTRPAQSGVESLLSLWERGVHTPPAIAQPWDGAPIPTSRAAGAQARMKRSPV